MDKREAERCAKVARDIVEAMRKQGDHKTSLKSAGLAWERTAERYEAMAK